MKNHLETQETALYLNRIVINAIFLLMLKAYPGGRSQALKPLREENVKKVGDGNSEQKFGIANESCNL